MFLKGFVAAVIIGLSLTATTIVFAQSDLTMTLDGQVIESDVPPFIENDRTMVPVRFISEAFGAEVDWVEDARLVTITKDHGVLIQLEIGSYTMERVHTLRAEYISLPDGDVERIVENYFRVFSLGLDVAAVIRDGRTFVPVRNIADALGIMTSWDAETRTVIFTSFVLDDFPEGLSYIEQYQFTGDYGIGLSPREAALRLLSVLMEGYNHMLEGVVSITLVNSHYERGVYFYLFNFGRSEGEHISRFRVTLDGSIYDF